MVTNQDAFPPEERLLRGAVLATIAHAIFIASDPTLSWELSWDGPNYSRQDSMGTRGTITFGDGHTVGVFRDEHSPRSPLGSPQAYDMAPFFVGAPTEVRVLAQDQALRYVLEEHEGIVQPIITSAFWSDGERLTAAEPWPAVVTHGAHVLAKEVMATEDAVTAWADDCEFSADHAALLRSLFERLMTTIGVPILLSDAAMVVLTAEGDDGLAESREALAGINILLPEP